MKETISKRKKVTNVKTKRRATLFGTLLSGSATLVPIGLALLSKVDLNKVNFSGKGSVYWLFLLGLSFAALPPLILIGNWITTGITTKRWFCLDNWNFFQADSTQDLTQEVSEDEERSSIEFERYFNQIIEEVITDSETKIVIVVDNLDRVDAKDSLKIWSTLQTFLQQRNPSHKSYTWAKHIWIIVPYDEEGLAKLWNSQSNDRSENVSADEKMPVSCAKSFFDKCFQLRVSVPTPILTDWEEFAKTQIEEAMPKWPDSEKEDLVDVLRLTRESLTDIPTPREIKTYVNQVGSMRIFSDSEMPTKSIGYFAVQRYLKNISVSSFREKLVEGILPYKSHKLRLPLNCARDMAGLIFGVDSKTGQQLLLEPEIENAMSSGNGEALSDLCKAHASGFWPAFRYHIARIELDETRINYATAVLEGLWRNHRIQCMPFVNKIKQVKLQFPTKININGYISFFELIEDGKLASRSWETIIGNLDSVFENEECDFDMVAEYIQLLTKHISCEVLTKIQINTDNEDIWGRLDKAGKQRSFPLFNYIKPPDSMLPTTLKLYGIPKLNLYSEGLKTIAVV